MLCGRPGSMEVGVMVELSYGLSMESWASELNGGYGMYQGLRNSLIVNYQICLFVSGEVLFFLIFFVTIFSLFLTLQ